MAHLAVHEDRLLAVRLESEGALLYLLVLICGAELLTSQRVEGLLSLGLSDAVFEVGRHVRWAVSTGRKVA